MTPPTESQVWFTVTGELLRETIIKAAAASSAPGASTNNYRQFLSEDQKIAIADITLQKLTAAICEPKV